MKFWERAFIILMVFSGSLALAGSHPEEFSAEDLHESAVWATTAVLKLDAQAEISGFAVTKDSEGEGATVKVFYLLNGESMLAEYYCHYHHNDDDHDHDHRGDLDDESTIDCH
jgi:hypothetical protein